MLRFEQRRGEKSIPAAAISLFVRSRPSRPGHQGERPRHRLWRAFLRITPTSSFCRAIWGSAAGWNVRARMAQHHHRVARGAHKVVTLLVHPSVLAMVKPVFVEPIGKVL